MSADPESKAPPEPAKEGTGVDVTIVAERPTGFYFERTMVKYPCCCCWLWFGFSMLWTILAMALLASGSLNFDQRGVWDVRDHEVQKQWDAFQLAREENGQDSTSLPKFETQSASLFDVEFLYYGADDDDLLNQEHMDWSRDTEKALMETSAFQEKCKLVRGVDTSKAPITFTSLDPASDKITASATPDDKAAIIFKGSSSVLIDGGLYHVLKDGSSFKLAKLSSQQLYEPIDFTQANQISSGAKFHHTLSTCAASLSLSNYLLPNSAKHKEALCNGFVATTKTDDVSVLRPTCGCDEPSVLHQSGTCVGEACAGQFGVSPKCIATNYVESGSSGDVAQGMQKFCPASMEQEPLYKTVRNALLPTEWSCGKPTSYYRSKQPMGMPLPGYSQLGGDQLDDQISDLEEWSLDFYATVQEIQNDANEKAPGESRVVIMTVIMITAAFNTIMATDGAMAFGSIIIVWFWVWCSTGSMLLASACVFECLISLPMAMAFWGMCGQKYVGFLCIMIIFVILGIGADDVFVLVDAWKQSGQQGFGDDIEARFVWAHRRARNAMLVTTLTTVFSFLAAGISDVPSISGFGFVAALVVLFDYIMCITFFSAVLLVYNKYFERKNACCPTAMESNCSSHMLCCPCACLQLDRPKMWKNPRVVVPAIVLFLLGVVFAIGFPLVGVAFLCASVVFVYATLNAQGDSTAERPIEKYFKTTFMGIVRKGSICMIIAWILVSLTGLILLATSLKLPTEEAPFLKENHPLQKYLSLSGKFAASGDNPLLFSYVVLGVDKENAIDRSGVDFQEPGSAWGKMTPDEPLGAVQYSDSARQKFLSAAGQQEVVDVCDATRAAPHIASSDADCHWVVWEGVGFPRWKIQNAISSNQVSNQGQYYVANRKTNGDSYDLGAIGSGYCNTGIYCFMYAVRDYLVHFCDLTTGYKSKWVNDRSCTDQQGNPSYCLHKGTPPTELCMVDGVTVGGPNAFPANNMEAILASPGYSYYYDKVVVDTWYGEMLTYDYSRRGSMTGVATQGGKFMFAYLGLNSSIPGTQVTYYELSDLMNLFQDFYDSRLKVNNDGYIVSFLFCWKLVTDALVKNTYQALAIGIVLCYVVITATTWNWYISGLAVLSVIAVVSTACGVIVAMGWELGIVEAIVLIVIVGISVDYSVHIAHAYNECEEENLPADQKQDRASIRVAKATEAIGTMGISLCSGFATSAGAALFLCFCEVTFFRKFGMFIIITLCISLVVTFTFLMPLLVVVGPTSGFGMIPCLRRRDTPKQQPEPSP